MRDILFRGQDIKGIWHEGMLAHVGNAWYISNSAGVPTAFEVIPETIGQFTGRTVPQSEERVFEGDILASAKFIGIVSYNDDKCCYMFTWRSRKGAQHRFMLKCVLSEFTDFENLRVVGNIHDNKPLVAAMERGDEV